MRDNVPQLNYSEKEGTDIKKKKKRKKNKKKNIINDS